MMLTWDDSFAIARELQREHPGVDLENISLITIYRWTLVLDGFRDDPELANDAILNSIFQEWFEEANPL